MTSATPPARAGVAFSGQLETETRRARSVPNTEESEVVSCALPVWASAVFSRQREIEARRPLCALTRQRAQSCIACKLVKHHHARCARAARVARAAKGANGKGSCCVRRLAGRERHRPQGPARRSRGNERLKRGAHALCQTRQRVRWSRARCPHGPARSSLGNERLRRGARSVPTQPTR
jgi:hypothetical protein